jgi:cyanate permease
MSDAPFSAWLTLLCVSLMFFLITAATFTSLGVVLPAMVGELHWSWGAAGSGFSLLGVFCGITSTIPATLIRRFGVRATLAAGSAVMAAAFLCLARAEDLLAYFAGCSLAGLGFTLLATVPGTYLLARVFARPSFAFGLYFTIGGLGGVAGPLLYFWVDGVSGGWRSYWLVVGAVVALAGLISAALVDSKTNVAVAANPDPDITDQNWRARDAMKTPQFFVLAAAYGIFLFVGITVNAVAVAHLMGHGISNVAAGSMISVEAFVNAGARFLGGALVRFIDARKLLLLSLAFLIAGLLALSVARDLPLMLVFAGGIGIGYGLTFFASTILLLDYFGRDANLELFSMVNLIATIGSVGPAFAGFVADRSGSFVPAFLALAVFTVLVLIAVIAMRPPKRVMP